VGFRPRGLRTFGVKVPPALRSRQGWKERSVFSDPFSITYDGNVKSLPRTEVARDYNRYTTADGEFEVLISNNLRKPQNGIATVSFKLARYLPDPTPGDFSNPYRNVRNSFGFSYGFDAITRAEVSVDVPRLRATVNTLIDSAFQGRLLGGER